jgi:amidase
MWFRSQVQKMPRELNMTETGLGLRSATALARSIAAKEISSRELLDHYRWRIEQLNDQLNAIVTFDWDRAQAAADAADEVTASGQILGPLHGLPVSIKDAIATEGIRSTGGATELSEHVPVADAPVVSSIRDAGAIVFGKSNLPRWSGDVQAFNPIFGTTNNPWDVTRGPGGSSGGASAAVAAGLTSFELGTDIGGSIRLPAHLAGVCGHKPSFGIVPQLGYLDHPTGGISEADVNVFGPLARSVDDLEVLLDVIAGPTDRHAPAWSLDLPSPRHESAEQLRVAAWLDDATCPVASDMAVLLERAAASLENAGATVDRSARPDITLSRVWEVGLPLVSAATTPARTSDEFARQIRQSEDQSLDPTTRMRATASAIRHRDWLLLTEERDQDRARWDHFFTTHDVLLCPVAASTAFPHMPDGNLYSRIIDIDGVERPYADLIAWTSFIGYVHLPSTVVPIGVTPGGLPVGIQVVAPYLEDRTGLAVARLLEELLGGYQVPPMAELG